uniref:Microprocessor complex subunit DGCR8 n=2 Tax=Timema TaxID=61471 RepID=A0A7R8VLA5_TIMDO|nr:unnamed protein product [Timema douglasi]
MPSTADDAEGIIPCKKPRLESSEEDDAADTQQASTAATTATNGCPYTPSGGNAFTSGCSDGQENDDDEGNQNFFNYREFDVLDEFERNDDDNENYDRESDSLSDLSYDSDIPDDEVEAMLEEGLPEEFKFKGSKRKRGVDLNEDGKPTPCESKKKTVLEEIGHNHFDVLPEGWVQVTHNSGMPIFLHKHLRVVTWTKPYFLGPGSARKHEAPLSAIPCLQYRRALQEKEALEEKKPISATETALNGAAEKGAPDCANSPVLPSARIETAQENQAQQSLDANSVQEYCRRLFRFKDIEVLRFRSWSDRRRFTKQKKQQRQLNRPTLPEGTKLIKFPIQFSAVELNTTSVLTNYTTEAENSGVPNTPRTKREWIMNPNGKSFVCILHEYVQHALKKQPYYVFKELDNAATPYSATVMISDMQYGVGYGTSKKQAKSDAAKATLEILNPRDEGQDPGGQEDRIQSGWSIFRHRSLVHWGGRFHIVAFRLVPLKEGKMSYLVLAIECTSSSSSSSSSSTGQFFDEIKIEDPRVFELCSKTTEPSPYAILLTCLQRNFGLGEMDIKYEVNTLRHQKNEFTMSVGAHTAKVICKNKREGKQRTSQAILQALHPHITSWGSLLRMYGNRSVKSVKDKKHEEQEITLLQSKASINQPNWAILDKLRQEMGKLSDKPSPIGKFVPPADENLPSTSGADLNNVQL